MQLTCKQQQRDSAIFCTLNITMNIVKVSLKDAHHTGKSPYVPSGHKANALGLHRLDTERKPAL